MKTLFVFLLSFYGFYCISAVFIPSVYPPAANILRKRSYKKVTQIQVVVQRFTAFIAKKVDLDPIRRTTLSDELHSLGYSITPELFQAQAIANGLIYSGIALLLGFLLLPFVLAIALSAFCGWIGYKRNTDKLHKALDQRRSLIERELPQFSSTIHQALNSTHNVISILESYRKICGHTLRSEIDQTLNEMKTGNPERALKSFESRIASAKLSQLTRGLVGVMRGDDRRAYFEMLSLEYQKAAGEAVSKELLLRPQKLYPYFGMLFGCLVLIIGIALGITIAQQLHTFF